MKKICERNALEVYERTGVHCWLSHTSTRSQLNPKWIEHAFTQSQIRFLEQHSYTARPHPKHSPTIEIFIDEQTLEEPEWTIVRLLF